MDKLETWKDIPGYEGHYQVSDLGNVRSLDRTVNDKRTGPRIRRGKPLRTYFHRDGHVLVHLYLNGFRSAKYVHSLVAETFIGKRPEGYHVCHNNGVPDDNRVTNLRYDTPKENARDSVNHGTHYLAGKTHCKRGHQLTNDNVYCPPGGKHRHCKICRRLYMSNYRAGKNG